VSRQYPALRGIAILLVVLHHSINMGTLYPPGYGYPGATGWVGWLLLIVQELGMLAVPTFFFISGGFAAYAARGNPPRLTWKAVWATLSRILWPYLIWSVAYYAFMEMLRGEERTVLGALRDLAIGAPYHFVPLLVFWYLFAPLVVRLSSRWGWLVVALLAVGQLVLINLEEPGQLGFVFPAWVRAVIPHYYNSVLADWAVYFPLGLVCSMRARSVVPWAKRWKWVLLAITVVFFAGYLLSIKHILHVPLAGYVFPTSFVLFCMAIERRWIPRVRMFEQFGKRSYGVYLMHLLVLWTAVELIRIAIPWLLGVQVVLEVVLFGIALAGSLLIMKAVARLPFRAAYRYLFG